MQHSVALPYRHGYAHECRSWHRFGNYLWGCTVDGGRERETGSPPGINATIGVVAILTKRVRRSPVACGNGAITTVSAIVVRVAAQAMEANQPLRQSATELDGVIENGDPSGNRPALLRQKVTSDGWK